MPYHYNMHKVTSKTEQMSNLKYPYVIQFLGNVMILSRLLLMIVTLLGVHYPAMASTDFLLW